MRLHARQLATAAGATSDQVDWIVEQMLAEGVIRLDKAQALVANMNGDDDRKTTV
jgi:hydroxymethylglutaryl-CoA reductase